MRITESCYEGLYSREKPFLAEVSRADSSGISCQLKRGLLILLPLQHSPTTCLVSDAHNMIRFIPTLPLRPTYLRRLLASQVPARSRSKHTVSGIARPAPPASFSTQDDGDLRQLFDRPTNTNSPSARPTGLFDYPLGPALSLRPLTERTLIHAQAIVDRICNSPGDPTESRRVVKNLDRLSDLLCGVIDMCELVRSVHPDQQWVDECDLVYERLSSFMNELNTHTGMYEVCLVPARS
jgi:hypothetical protein